MNSSKLLPFRTALFAAALLLALVGTSGCTSVQVTSDDKAVGEYKFGNLIVEPTQPFDKVREATKKAIKDIGYFLVKDESEAPGKAELKARTANDTTVSISLETISANLTKVKIRHGLKGELAPAQALYQAIAKNF
jgi:hypothetical protein